MLRVTEIRDPEALIALRPEWETLADRADADDPYQRFEYVYPWAKYAARGGRLRALIVRDGGRLVGLALLMSGTAKRFGIHVGRISFLTKGTVPSSDLIVPEAREEIVQAMFEHLISNPEWEVLQLFPVPADSPHVAILQRLAQQSGFTVSFRPNRDALYVDMAGTWPAYLKRVRGSDRKEIRRIRRRIEARGRVTFERLGGSDLDLPVVMDDILKVIQRSWKGKEGVEPGFLAFLNEFAGLLRERGWLSVSLLRLDGKTIAFVLEILFRRRLFPFYCAYDEAHADRGPGAVLMSKILERSFEEGIRTYDFGTDWPYLRRWPHRSRALNELMVFRRSLSAGLFRHWHLSVRPVMDRLRAGAAARQGRSE